MIARALVCVLALCAPAEAQCALPLDFSGTQYTDCMTDLLRAGDIAAGLG